MVANLKIHIILSSELIPRRRVCMPGSADEDNAEKSRLLRTMDAQAVPSGAAAAEFARGGTVLLLAVVDQVLLTGASTHLPALLMLDVTASLGISISVYSLCIGVGNVLKAVILLLAAGPTLRRFGASTCAILTTAAAAILLGAAALAPERTTFCAALVALVTATAFSEMPTFVVLLATHFEALLPLATSCAASAFSFAGALLPLLLSPVLAAQGWRAVLGAGAAGCVLILPTLHSRLVSGTLAVGGEKGAQPAQSEREALDATPPASLRPAVRGTASSCHVRVRAAGDGAAGSAGPDHDVDPRPPALPTDPLPSPRFNSQSSRLPPAALASGISAREAFRGGTFWALWGATFLHLLYGSLLSGHLTTLLRTSAGLDVVAASAVTSVQFACAIAGKVLSGALLSLTARPAASATEAVSTAAARTATRRSRAVRTLLFVLAPLAYASSHLLLVDVRIDRLSRAGLVGGDQPVRLADAIHAAVAFTTNRARLVAYAVVVGSSFGLLFGMLQCLPARLFGRRDLASIQSATFVAILVATSMCAPAACGAAAPAPRSAHPRTPSATAPHPSATVGVLCACADSVRWLGYSVTCSVGTRCH